MGGSGFSFTLRTRSRSGTCAASATAEHTISPSSSSSVPILSSMRSIDGEPLGLEPSCSPSVKQSLTRPRTSSSRLSHAPCHRSPSPKISGACSCFSWELAPASLLRHAPANRPRSFSLASAPFCTSWPLIKSIEFAAVLARSFSDAATALATRAASALQHLRRAGRSSSRSSFSTC